MTKNLYDNKDFWVDRVRYAKSRNQPNLSVYKVSRPHWDNIVRVRVEALNKFIKTTDKIVDFGCGYGWLSQEITNPYVGVDQTPALIEYGRHLYSGVDFLESRLQDGLPFEDGSFDVAFSSCVKFGILECEELGEMPKGRWASIEKEMLRVAKTAIIFSSYGNEYEVLER